MLSAITPSFLSAPGPSQLTAANVRWLAEQVAASRETHAALDSAIRAHEATSLQGPSSSALAPRAASGGGGRGGRGSSNFPANRRDARVKPPRMDKVPSSIPRNLGSQLVFDRTSIRSTIGTSTSGITETNYGWSLNTHPEVSHWSVLFDQWCLVEATVVFQNLEPPSSTGSTPELHTALDFDSFANLGSVALIDDFGSSQTDVLIFNKKVVRSVRPCCKPDLGGTGGAAVARSWVDSANPGIPHYGIRTIIPQAISNANTLTVQTYLVFAFRNSI